MDLREYVWMVKAHIVGILALTALGVAAAAGYTITQPEVYSANASGFVTTGVSSDGVSASVSDSLAKSRAASYVDIATSRAVAELAGDDLGITDNPAGLVGKISVTQPNNTVLIKISAKAASPVEAQQLADAWVKALSTRIAQLENPEGRDAPGILGVEPIEAAALPTSPISPQPQRNLIAGGLMGLAAGLLYALVRSRMDRRLRTSEAIEDEFRVPIVGLIPAHRKAKKKRHGLEIAAETATDKSWGTGEAFRKLRTNLAYMKVDNPPQVIVVTSPNPQDGKSTTAANLAAAIALGGHPVTLVDADLRRPTIATSMGLVEGAGLTDVLIGRAELSDVLQHVDGMGADFSVLAAGSVPPNPSELVGSMAMQHLLADLATRGYVVIDAPPLLPVTDGQILTRHSDGALVVVRHGVTLDHHLRNALADLETVNGTVLGVVFNAVPPGGSYYGYYGQYHDQKVATPKPAAQVGGHRR